MHLNQCLLQNVSDSGLDVLRVFLYFVHLVFHMYKLLLDRLPFFVQLNVVFLCVVVGIGVGFLDSD
jgi:hypothetical protein